ncbi:hypothetical protein NDU88_005622 [Pleurodeles waltl]|uniref:Uncharacterized protein n=1 Tax=Pleurodeles waltl TaxID=8319 RepID=A0AAV7LCZ0_PLEWA|nr:hypothetical protein NDU88_005622 [Pleurodeles waltl]
MSRRATDPHTAQRTAGPSSPPTPRGLGELRPLRPPTVRAAQARTASRLGSPCQSLVRSLSATRARPLVSVSIRLSPGLSGVGRLAPGCLGYLRSCSARPCALRLSPEVLGSALRASALSGAALRASALSGGARLRSPPLPLPAGSPPPSLVPLSPAVLDHGCSQRLLRAGGGRGGALSDAWRESPAGTRPPSPRAPRREILTPDTQVCDVIERTFCKWAPTRLSWRDTFLALIFSTSQPIF